MNRAPNSELRGSETHERERERERGRWPAWPRVPAAPHPLSMKWRDGLFVHFPVDPEELRPEVPATLDLETYDGRAWVSVLPFVLANVGLRGTPSAARLSVAELNVRTYVRFRDDPGLFFFSIDLGSAGVASLVRRLSRLPCYRATMHVSGGEDRVAFSSARADPTAPSARFAATYRPEGEVHHADDGSLAKWLIERRRFFAPDGTGVLTAEIAHAPWPLQSADVTIHENTMLEANDLPAPIGEPVCHFARELEMTGSLPRRVRMS